MPQLGAGTAEDERNRIDNKLADRSKTHPLGVMKDVLVQVNKLIFPTDFFIMRTKEDDDDASDSVTLLLGRPFVMIAKANIDFDECTVSVKFDNICDSMKYPVEEHFLYSIKIMDVVV